LKAAEVNGAMNKIIIIIIMSNETGKMEKIPDNNNYGGSDDRVLLRPKGLGIFAFFVMWVGYSAVWFLMETFSLSCCQL
jgi:hypothetical protein